MNNNEEFSQEEPDRLEEIVFGMILQTRGSKENLGTGIKLLKAQFPHLVVTGIESNDFGFYAGGWRAYLTFNIGGGED